MLDFYGIGRRRRGIHQEVPRFWPFVTLGNDKGSQETSKQD